MLWQQSREGSRRNEILVLAMVLYTYREPTGKARWSSGETGFTKPKPTCDTLSLHFVLPRRRHEEFPGNHGACNVHHDCSQLQRIQEVEQICRQVANSKGLLRRRRVPRQSSSCSPFVSCWVHGVVSATLLLISAWVPLFFCEKKWVEMGTR